MFFFGMARCKVLILLVFCLCSISFAQPKTGGYNGKMNGVKSWQLPNAPSGTRPDQAWHSIGSAPDGDIYISGHDHATNAMLYRLNQRDDTLRWVGDARTASTAANNWLSGETCQKFHTRPTYLNGKVYVASLDRSTLDNAFQSTRGFHWYAYDIAQSTFTDLSVSEPNGIGASKIQLVTLSADPKRNVIYGASIPECKFVSYNVAAKATTVLNRPSQWTAPQYIYSNRYMWVDSRSRLYISAGNARAQWYMGENASIYNKLYYYDPTGGFGVSQFALQGANSMEVGQWNREHTKCYLTDDQGHLYCFDDNGPTWTYLGRPGFDAGFKVWTIEVSPDGEKLYVGRCDNTNAIFEFDIAAKTSRQICTVAEMDDQAGSTAFMTGYDTWDRNGNFYIADFSMNDGRNVILTRVNPVKIKVAKGLLPALVEVSAQSGATAGAVTVTRTGATTSALNVIYEVAGFGSSSLELKKTFGSVTIPAGSASASVAVDQAPFTATAGVASIVFSVAFDGDNYLAATARNVTLASVAIRNGLEGATPRNGDFMQTIRSAGGGYVIRLTVERPSLTQLNLYDVKGRLVTTLVNRHLDAGSYDFPLKERTGRGILRSGYFIAEVKAGSQSMCRKVVGF
jgi:WD40 repeat protein